MMDTIATLADLAAILLVVETFILCLVPLLLFGGAVYGMRKVNRATRPALQQGGRLARRVAEGADRASTAVAEPFIRVSAAAAAARFFIRNLPGLIRRREER
ncbi:MAG: hypothetical protein D6759_20500 [Chloroflexi bacterium]|nr:MAG: hypothetical protein D6759_20500 [Chloroflexota bacterium]